MSDLIKYIQNEAIKLRHGIRYTSMLDATLGSFKRPKDWSTTPMGVYEFEMLERFLENGFSFTEYEHVLNTLFTSSCTTYTNIHIRCFFPTVYDFKRKIAVHVVRGM